MICAAATSLLLLSSTQGYSQEATVPRAVVPAGTPLAVAIDGPLPMRVGQQIQARSMYPVYADDVLILPAHTLVSGSVVALRSDKSRRIRSGLGGDFTPFHIPVVRFTQIILADGTAVAFSSATATDGAPVFRSVAPPPVKGGFVRRQFSSLKTVARDDAAIFAAPGKGDRFKQFIYTQLPYHPQRIEKGTAWTIDTIDSIAIAPQSAPLAVVDTAPPVHHFWEQPPTPVQPPVDASGRWMIQANLDGIVSSESSKMGQTIEATVAEPIYNPDHSIAVPQGSKLVGAVTQAKHSRRFGRTGVLNFSFRQLTLPGGKPQTVETTLAGADSEEALALNSEGQVKAKPQDKLSVPIFLALIASRPLDGDGGRHRFRKNAAGGAAGLGLAGTVISLAGGSARAAAGIGYFGAAVAAYYRWIVPGKKITFPRDTRIVVQTVVRQSAPMMKAN